MCVCENGCYSRKERKKNRSTYSTWMGMQRVERTGAYLPVLPSVIPVSLGCDEQTYFTVFRPRSEPAREELLTSLLKK